MTKACAAIVPTRSPHQRGFAKKAGTPACHQERAMKINGQVQKILASYESDNPGTRPISPASGCTVNSPASCAAKAQPLSRWTARQFR
jgi:hypothetical protein